MDSTPNIAYWMVGCPGGASTRAPVDDFYLQTDHQGSHSTVTAPTPSQRRTSRAQVLIRITVSAVLVGVILSRVDASELAGLLPRVSPVGFAVALALFLLDRVVMAWRWHRLMRAKAIGIPWIEIVRMYFVSGFLGLFMPSSVAPDLIRVYMATRHGCHWTDAVSSVFLDRFIAFVTLAGIALGASVAAILPSSSLHLPPWILVMTSGPLLLCALVVAVLRTDYALARPTTVPPLARKLLETLNDFRCSITSYREHFNALQQVTVLSLLNHTLYILMSYVVVVSLDLHVSFLVLCIIVPLVSFLTMVPISLAGLGVQEGALVYFLSQAGVSPQEAFAVAILIRIIMTLGCLPGAFFYLIGSGREAGSGEKSY